MIVLQEYEINGLTETLHSFQVEICPWCNSKRIEFESRSTIALPVIQIKCVECGARGPEADTYKMASDRWNSMWNNFPNYYWRAAHRRPPPSA